MIDRFKKFEGSQNGKRTDQSRVTFSPRRYFALNSHAYRAMGSPPAVELYFDEQERKIGMLPCNPHLQNAFKIRKETGRDYYIIYAGTFCTHFLITTTRTVLFEGLDLNANGMLILDMNKTVCVGRTARRLRK